MDFEKLCSSSNSTTLPIRFMFVAYGDLMDVRMFLGHYGIRYFAVHHIAENSDKKDHTHFYCECTRHVRENQYYRVNQVMYLTPVNDAGVILRYFMHRDIKSREVNKRPYDFSDVFGTYSQGDLVRMFETAKDTTANVVDCIIALRDGGMSYSEFYRLFPRFLYNPRAVEILMRQIEKK